MTRSSSAVSTNALPVATLFSVLIFYTSTLLYLFNKCPFYKINAIVDVSVNIRFPKSKNRIPLFSKFTSNFTIFFTNCFHWGFAKLFIGCLKKLRISMIKIPITKNTHFIIGNKNVGFTQYLSLRIKKQPPLSHSSLKSYLD